MSMKMIWELYENRYLIEICNNGKYIKVIIELFSIGWYLLLVCYA